jgi:hypothetical protein
MVVGGFVGMYVRVLIGRVWQVAGWRRGREGACG